VASLAICSWLKYRMCFQREFYAVAALLGACASWPATHWTPGDACGDRWRVDLLCPEYLAIPQLAMPVAGSRHDR